MFFRKIVNIIQGPLKQIDRIAMKFEFANKPIKDDPGISKLMKITLPNLNEMVLNLNNYKKKVLWESHCSFLLFRHHENGHFWPF